MPAPEVENRSIRPYMRMASYWLDRGLTESQIMDWARQSRHYYDLDYMRAAIPEAIRANFFRAVINESDPNSTFSRLWGLNTRATWYAGYGRAPSAEERSWAYSRPEEQIGLMFSVVGRGARSGRYQHYTITANAAWGQSLASVVDYVRSCVAEGSCITGDLGSEPLRPDEIRVELIGGALVAREGVAVTAY